MNDATITDYAEALVDGAIFPPIIVFFDGEHYWLADGFHRLAANERVGNAEIEADVRDGEQYDAIRRSLSANETHGLRRTNADKRNAVLVALRYHEWSKLSARDLAKLCGVSHNFVAQVKRELSSDDSRAMKKSVVAIADGKPFTDIECHPMTQDLNAEVADLLDLIRPHVSKASREAKIEIRRFVDLQIELHGVSL
jgi:ParB-like chromosome segregation protein Spo0J